MRSTPRSRSTWAWALVAVVAVVLAACGPTRQRDQDAAGARPGSDLSTTSDEGLADDGLTVANEGAGTAGGTGGSRPGGATSVRTGGGGTEASGVGVAGPAGATSGGLGASAPGVTDTEINVGMVYDQSAGANNAAFGFAGIGEVDQKRAWETLVADVNERGGVAGRKLKIVFHPLDSNSGKTQETHGQEMCSTFTQDNRVFAVFTLADDTLKQCLTEAGVVQVGGATTRGELNDSQTLRDFPYVVLLGAAADRVMRFAVDRLHALGYYAKGRESLPFKLGVLRWDEPVFARASKALHAALVAKGLKVSDEVAIRPAATTEELADEFAAIRAAAVKFKANNITHVQFIGEPSARLPLIFMQSAEKQLYRPRYGLVSTDGGQALATLLGSDAQSQLSQSLLVGWNPFFDVRAQDYSGDKTTEAFRRCIETLERGGERFGEGDPTRNKEAIAAGMCDTINYFKAAVDTGGPVVTPARWLAGVATINGLDSAGTFILTTTDKRRDAVGGVRDDKWFDDCSCFRYISGVHPV